MRSLRTGLVLFLAVALPLCLARAEEITRIDQLREQIKATESLLEQATRNNEKAQLQTRLDRLRRELQNQEERQRLEARERELEQALASTPQSALRETLRRIDLSADHLKKEIERTENESAALETQRDTLVEQRAALKPENDRQLLQASELEERVFALREGIVALQLERDALNHEYRLAQEVDRIDEEMKSVQEPSTARLASVLEARSNLTARANQLAGETALLSTLRASREVSAASLELARQKLAQIDEEISILEKQTGIFNSNAQSVRLLNIARSQKKYLDQRATYVERQVAAIDRRISAIMRTSDLLTKESTWLQIAYLDLRTRYLRRLITPIGVIGGLGILYLLLARVILPRVRHRENLVLYRRFTRYLLLLTSVAVIGAFLFEDLRMFVTTLGIVSAAIVIALQDVAAAIAGWVVIMTGGKFRIGDRIEVEGDRGDVLDIDLLRTTILEVAKGLESEHPTGRVIVLPNSFVLKTKVFNASHGHPYVWCRQVFTFAFESPWREAEKMITRVVNEETAADFEEARRAGKNMEKRYGVPDAEYSPKIHVRIAEYGTEFACLHVCHFRKMDETATRIHRRVAAEMSKDPRLQIAIPTARELGSNWVPPAQFSEGPAISAVASVPGTATITVGEQRGNGHSHSAEQTSAAPPRSVKS